MAPKTSDGKAYGAARTFFRAGRRVCRICVIVLVDGVHEAAE
jgi:hypothetical protein